MKLPISFLASIGLAISCVHRLKENSIVEFTGVNQAVVYISEPTVSGDRLHFLRIDCRIVSSKTRKCMEVPIADGIVKEPLGNGNFRVEIDPGGRIEGFPIVRKHKATDTY